MDGLDDSKEKDLVGKHGRRAWMNLKMKKAVEDQKKQSLGLRLDQGCCCCWDVQRKDWVGSGF